MTINPEWLISETEIGNILETADSDVDYRTSGGGCVTTIDVYGVVQAQAEHMVKMINKMVNDDLFSKRLGVLTACEVLQEITGVKPNSIESEE